MSRRATPLGSFLLGVLIGINCMLAINGNWPWWMLSALALLTVAGLVNAVAATYNRKDTP